MPGKKDTKKDTKKGGKPEPEKKKEDEKKAKDDKKGAKDDKKGGKDDKKSGKDDKKGGKKGKEEPSKGKDEGKKGKDKGKGKKVESEEEEEELLSDEEEEEFSEEEDWEDSEDNKKRKGQGGKAKKGGKSRRGDDSEEDDEDYDDSDDDDEEVAHGKSKKKSKDDHHHKGGKSDADVKKKKGKKKEEPLVPVKEVPKKGLKNMSKMFMKFSGIKRRKNSVKKLKSTSRLFLGLGRRKSRLAKKKRRKSMMKNTSRFMMKFKSSQKKKKEKEAKEKAAAHGGKKPTYMLLRLGGGNSNKKKGGFFRSLFKKQDGTSDDFKNSSALLGKVAAATNWLTKRFLSKKMQENSRHHGLDGHRGKTRQSSSRRFLHGYQNNGYTFGEEDDGYDQHYVVDQRGYRYEDGYDDYGVESAPGYARYGQYGYYENEMEGADYQDLGYYEEDGLYDTNVEYYDDGFNDYNNLYSSAQGYYDTEEADYYGYQQQQAMYNDEVLDYYPQMHMGGMYGGDIGGFLDPQTQFYYDENDQGAYYANRQLGYSNIGPQGYYGDPVVTMEMQGGFQPDFQVGYSKPGIYQDLSSQQTAFPHGAQQVFELGVPGMGKVDSLNGNQYVGHMNQIGDDLGGIQQGDITFRVPRPQVRLFGKERLDVPLPPPPTLPPDPEFEDMSDIQYEDQVPLMPYQLEDMSFQQQIPVPEPQLPMFPFQQQQLLSPQQILSPQQPMMFQQENMLPQMMPTQMSSQQQLMPQQIMLPQQQMMSEQLFQQQPISPQLISPQMMADPMMIPQRQGYSLPTIPTPTAMIIKEATMSPLPTRRMQSSPTPSRRSVIIPSPQMQRHPSAMGSPVPTPMAVRRQIPSPQPSMRGGLINAQRPSSVLSRQISQPASPMVSPVLHRRGQPPKSLSPLARASSPPYSPRASVIRRSPPSLERGSMRQHSPLSSPHISRRMQSPQPSPTSARSPVGGRKIHDPPSLYPGHASPPLSPQLSRRPSPSPSHRSLSPAGPRPAPSSPTLSRRSTRLLRDPTPLARPRAFGNVPLGTVRPSPMGLRGRPVPPPTQNVSPFRASSVRSNRSSVLTIDSSLHSSPFHSPLMVHRTPLGRKESVHPPLRPIARGRPLRARQSIRSMPPPSPQPSLKYMSRSPSPRLSPRLNHQSVVSDPYADPYAEPSPQFVDPSSPMLSRSLQNQYLRLHSPSTLRPQAPQMVGMGQMAPELVEFQGPSMERPMSVYEQPLLPSSMLSGALQNQAVRGASYVSPLQRPQSPYAPSVPSSPLLSGAMKHSQAMKGMTSYQTPQLQSPYGPTVVMPYDYISEPGPTPLLQDALQNQTGFPPHPYTEVSQQLVAPSSPMLSRSLQNQAIQPDAFSALAPEAVQMVGMGLMAPELLEPHDSTLQRPTSPYQQPLLPPAQMLSGALQNQAIREASYVSPIQRPQSPYTPSVPSSPLLSGAMRHSQAMKGMTSYQTPQLQSPYGPTVGTPYDYISEPSTVPLLQDALQNQTGLRNVSNLKSPIMQQRNPYAPAGPQLQSALQQNPNLRQASFQTPMQLRRSSVVTQSPSSPMLGRALQNPQLMQASYQLPGRTFMSPYADPRSSPLLGRALQNQQVRSASYIMPDGSVIRDPRLLQKPMSPNLSGALQNQHLRMASYTLPDGTIIDSRQKHPISPNLSRALNNPAIREASYSLPDGTIVIDSKTEKTPNLTAALQNPYLKSASYTLPDGTIIIDPRKPTSPNLSNALQHSSLRNASFTLPQGVRDPNTPVSPNLAKALANQALKAASYTLPDGTIIVDPRKPKSPNLTAALQNPYLKGVSYALPDGTIIIDPRKPAGPNLSKALLNQDLRSATYRLPDGSLVMPGQKPSTPNLAAALRQNQGLRSAGLYHLSDTSVLSGAPKPTSPNLTSALQNEELRGITYRLPDGSLLTRQFRNPKLSDAIQNQQLRYASYTVPTELQGEDHRYAVIPPYGPRSGHWARNARGGGEGGENVWAAERVLPHGTVQNLSKWSMYKEDGMLEAYSPSPQVPEKQLQNLDWTPGRARVPGQSWYDKIFSIISMPTTNHRVVRWAEGMEDMTQLPELNETTVLMNLKKRFDHELTYTYIGNILVSVNPYKLLNIYGTDMVHKYEGHGLSDNPPHLFAIANLSYTSMMDAKKDQCIVISGESGSGKTEATKLILRYLTAINYKRNVAQQIEILEATPLLESFGNAKTVRNDNSSRFGKYTQIYMEEGVISGAITSQYLLEKSRIVFQAKSERNYHIFYEMLAGLSPHEKCSLYLQEAETYYYLNQGGNCAIEGKDDGEDFRRLLNAMDILCFTPEEQNGIYRLLSSVLHLGNVYFQSHQVEGQEAAAVVSAQEIRVVAVLLQVSPESLQKAVTYKMTDTGREKIYTPLTVDSALDARDAVAKILYTLLFSWLTERINGRVYPRTEALSISVLDIYGFEELQVNSFEQLCINYANETLQFYFNRVVFQEEQEEYMREQIQWQPQPFSNNQACLDLIAAKPHGILRILDDQCGFPQATDHTFLQKCHYHHGNDPLYARPKMPLPEFTLKHYAGKVTYQVHKFLDKNFDLVRQDVLDLFIQSRNRMVSSLFLKHSESLTQQHSNLRRNSAARRHQTNTVSAKFQSSLQELLDKMERYKALLCLKDPLPADGENCVIMLHKLCPVKEGSYQVGVSKIFLKEELYQLLEGKRDRVLDIAAMVLQRYTRMCFARQKFLKFRRGITRFEARCRGYLVRKKIALRRKYLIRLRSAVLLIVNRQRYMRTVVEPARKAEEDRINREVVNVTTLPIPAELAGLLQAASGGEELHSDCLAVVQAPKVQVDPQLTLPLDINNYLITHYIRIMFREPLFGMLTAPLENSLIRLDQELKQGSLNSFILILRFMGDPNLNGAQENMFGNYIIQRGLSNPSLRDEILAQIANQVWRNPNVLNSERGWLLFSSCLSAFLPSQRLAKYLLKFVSDYGPDGYDCVCQNRLLQALQRLSVGPEYVRTYPPSLLEWTANRKKAHTVLHVHCFDGMSFLCPLHSWTTGEEMAKNILQHRGVVDGRQGWSVLLKEPAQWVELEGSDYVLDLMSDLELPADFPKHNSYFIISALEPARVRPNASISLLGGGFDISDDVSPSAIYDSDRFNQDLEPQRGMDRYLDSLFDPVLSDGAGEEELTAGLSHRMKGAGGVGGKWQQPGQSSGHPPPPGAVRVLPVGGMMSPPVAAVAPVTPEDQQAVLAEQQQAIVNQQAVIMAQQMTMQAMAMVSSPVSSPLTSPITSPPMSPVPHHALTSPYAVIPPSPYANIPPSPYANFTPTPYAAAVFPPSPYFPSAQRDHTESQPNAQRPADPPTEPRAQRHSRPAYRDPHLSSSKAEPAQPTFKPAVQTHSGVDGVSGRKAPGVLANKEPARKFAPVGTSPPPPAGEVVKYSSQTADHIVPSQDIQAIIRGYNSPSPPAEPQPAGKRRPDGKFKKKQTPRDEALQILKPQMDNPPAPQPKHPVGPTHSASAIKQSGLKVNRGTKMRAPDRPLPKPPPGEHSC
ncbi:unconventional myosin-XV-like isoform X2 [Poecilia latipinna]|uniref:unconventional myosin-XV-like isoform X2 n=1 Tax=Poecilia latipinna TaxID=48699 RepID=UPI00072EA273|nr:PREDICTED: unconventional myosin-XV-like isoform X2 [Poecilia latipinna]